MKNTDIAKPILRLNLRLALGKTYYTLLRFIQWKKHEPYAKSFSNKKLPEVHFKHKTILLRKLKEVDMKYQYRKIINLKIAVSQITV